MSSMAGEELMDVGGPELDDLAALLMLDEYAVANDLDNQQWLPSTPQLSSSPSPASTPTPSSPATESVESGSSPRMIEDVEDSEQRKKRHRESMARYRQERRDRVDTMKDQARALQRILMQVLAHNKPIANGETQTSLQRYQSRFTEMVRLREALLLEKDELTKKLVFHDQRARAFQSISEQVFSKSMFVFPRTPGGVWLRYDEDEAPFYYEPIKEEVCRQIIALGLKKMSEYLRSLPQGSAMGTSVVSTSNLMGWNAERAYLHSEKGPVMLFRFSQRVPKTVATLDDMMERAWKIYTSPDVMTRSSASSVRTQLVQQVDDDIVIMIRNAPEKKHVGRSRYLALYHRMWSGDKASETPRRGRSAMIFTTIMNRTPKEDQVDLSSSLRNSRNWLKEGCALLRLTEKPTTPSYRDDGIDVEYMGYVECRDLMHGEHMWTELCLLMLLWGQAVVPQQLLTL